MKQGAFSFFKKNGIDFFVLLLVPLSSLVFWSRLPDDTLFPRFFLLAVVLLTVFIFGSNVASLDRNLVKNKVFVFYLIFFILNVISLLIAQNITEGLLPAGQVFLNMLLILVLYNCFQLKHNFFETLVKALVIAILIHGMLMAKEFYDDGVNLANYKSVCMVTSLMGNKNLFAEYIAITLPFAIYAALQFKSNWKIAGLMATGFALCVIVLLQARSAWVAVFCAAVFFIIITGIRKKNAGETGRKRSLKNWLPVFLFAAVVLTAIGTNQKLKTTLSKRLVSVFEIEKNGSAKGRLVLWKKSVNVFKNQPIFGVGPGNWKTEFQKYNTHEVTSVFNIRPMNDFVLVLCETGLAGFLIYLFSIAVALVFLLKIYFSRASGNYSLMAITIFCSLIIYMIVSCFSYPKERAEHNILFSICIAASVFLHNKVAGAHGSKYNSKWISVAAVSFCLFLLTVCIFRMKGEYYTARALQAKAYQRQPAVIDNINKAENIFYKMDATTTPVSWYRGVAKFMLNDTTALHDFEEAWRYNPSHIHVLNNLGTALDHAGRHAEAEVYYRKALAFCPGFTDAITNLSILLINRGRYADAKKILTTWRSRKNETYYMLKDIVVKNLHDTSKWKN